MAKKICLIFTLLTFLCFKRVNACAPLDVPNLLNQTVSGTSLLLNWESITIFSCPGYSVEVEMICLNAPFTGTDPFYYTPELNKTVITPQAYAQQTIDISGFCPGQIYMFRAREVNNTIFSNWSSSFTFTVPGNPGQPTLTLSASANTICPGQSSQLNSSSSGCGQGTNMYSWFPSAGLSCTNCPNPVASPTTLTTYTCLVQGAQTSCWSANNTIVIAMNPASSPGTVMATPSVCAGNSATVGLTGGGPVNQWQLSTDTGVTWSVTGFSNTALFSTGTLTANQCFRAVVNGCGISYTSAPMCITVYNLPQISINSNSSIICEGESALLTATGAQSYLWTSASFITTPQVTVSPVTTTTYYVNGTDNNGCSNTASYVVEVSSCTGLNERERDNEELTILPNPNSGYFSIKSRIAGQFKITNELGQLLQTITLDVSNNNTASVQQLSPGIYFIISATRSGTCKKISIIN